MPEDNRTAWTTAKAEDIKVGDRIRAIEKYKGGSDLTITYEGAVVSVAPVTPIATFDGNRSAWIKSRDHVEVELFKQLPPLPTAPGSAVLFYSVDYLREEVAFRTYTGWYEAVSTTALSEAYVQTNFVKVLHDAGA